MTSNSLQNSFPPHHFEWGQIVAASSGIVSALWNLAMCSWLAPGMVNLTCWNPTITVLHCPLEKQDCPRWSLTENWNLFFFWHDAFCRELQWFVAFQPHPQLSLAEVVMSLADLTASYWTRSQQCYLERSLSAYSFPPHTERQIEKYFVSEVQIIFKNLFGLKKRYEIWLHLRQI